MRQFGLLAGVLLLPITLSLVFWLAS